MRVRGHARLVRVDLARSSSTCDRDNSEAFGENRWFMSSHLRAHDDAGQPAWEIAHLFPNQGNWSVDDYLELNSNRLVELSDGRVEVLPMPTELHQLIAAYLYDSLKAFVSTHQLGIVLFAPLRIQLWEGKSREPDVVFLSTANQAKRGVKYWTGADFVIEVVSDDDPHRDLVTKRSEYARAGIAEYWIIEPSSKTILVLSLPANEIEYSVEHRYCGQNSAHSILLPGFQVPVAEVFAQK